MRKKVLSFGRKFLRQELVSGSIYIFIGSIFGNVINFLFNLFMSRNLAVEDYGVITSAISLIMLTTIPIGAVIPTVVNFAGLTFAKGDYGVIKTFFFKIIKPLVFISLIILFCFIVFAKNIGDFFHIKDQFLIIIVGLIVSLAYIGIINSGLLQAKLEFKFISFSNFIGSFIKLLVGVLLVFLGFNLRGAMWALFLSSLIPFILSFIPLRIIFKSQDHISNTIHFKNFLSYGVPSSLATLGLMSLISTDILLVKHFYDPLHAGVYAGLSLVGRVIFFLTAPISMVMFPLVVQKHAKNENYDNIFKMAIALVFFPSVLISILYFLYPDLAIIFFIKNKTYLSASHLLGLFGVFITIYSLISLFTYYFLSIKKTKVYIPIVLSAITQLVLIYFNHDSLFKVVIISLVISIILLFSLLTYCIKVYRERRMLGKVNVVVNIPSDIRY